ncbi:MAG TPA: serine hydrolase domain-containing protein [Candidatus Udaeobacter sp.]|nr:serine hydrolase domain-containing protein [Candidatus Udaeobacter sp.]
MKSVSIARASVVLSVFVFSGHAALGEPTPSPTSSATINSLSSEVAKKIDEAATKMLNDSGVPSASIAVVKDGKVAYTKAYGLADIASHRPATTSMIYSIGSISKQFTVASILLLAEEGKLSIDDPVGHWLPHLTRANEVTVRHVLSMTSGYQDFWPQDYVMPLMMKPVSPEEILKGWAQKPLDFDPGTKWQYSNTNYVVAGVIVEQVSGVSVFELLRRRVFDALRMNSVFDCDSSALPSGAPTRYHRYGLGPARPAPKEGKGWLFAAGELAMTPSDLAKWDISIIDQAILKPLSYREMETAELLKNGASSQYGLGVGVSLVNGRRVLAHGGEISGFTAQNAVYPDDRAAVIVLTNMDANRAAVNLANKIGEIIFAPVAKGDSLAQAKTILVGLQKGKIDRSLFTDNANFYFDKQCLQDLASSLAPLGAPTEFQLVSEGLRGGMTSRRYRAKFQKKTLEVSTYTLPDGKLEQYIVSAE